MRDGGSLLMGHFIKRYELSRKKKNPPDFSGGFVCRHYLFSRAVTSQVSSAQMSLTSVFGMGTGGPSSQSTPTCNRLSDRPPTAVFCRAQDV